MKRVRLVLLSSVLFFSLLLIVAVSVFGHNVLKVGAVISPGDAWLSGWRAEGSFIALRGTNADDGVANCETGSISGRYLKDCWRVDPGGNRIMLVAKGYTKSDMYCTFPMPSALSDEYNILFPGKAGTAESNLKLSDYNMVVEIIPGHDYPGRSSLNPAPVNRVIAPIVDRAPRANLTIPITVPHHGGGFKGISVIACSPAVLRTLGVKGTYVTNGIDPETRTGSQINAFLVKDDDPRFVYKSQNPIGLREDQ